MPKPSNPPLKAGRVYRTEDLSRWGKNPSRLIRRLVRKGRLRQIARGLFLQPRRSSFGEVPPRDEELLRSFLRGGPFLITGPERWNSLGIGATALFSRQLVYNTKRSGEFDFGGAKFLLRRVPFPKEPTAEWFAIDLIENRVMAGVSMEDLEKGLREAVVKRRLDRKKLLEAAHGYGTKRTRTFVEGLVTEMVRA